MKSPAPSTIQPFKFQTICIQDTYQYWKQRVQKILLIAGCGAGKTYMASLILRDVTHFSQQVRRCIFLVDRNNLLEQAAEEMTDLGVHCTIFQGSRIVDWSAPVIVVSCQTLEARIKSSGLEPHYIFSQLFGRVDLIVPDEAHDVCWRESYLQLEEYYQPQKTRFLGLTATPYRTKADEYLGQRFQVAVCAPQPPELVKIGRIVTCRSFGFNGLFDYKKLRIGKDGDYQESDLESQALRPEALELIVSTWIERGQNSPTVAFCATVQHARQLAAAFRSAGIAADYQDGKTSTELRKEQDKGLTNKSIQVICSVNTQTKGWNLKAVRCIIFATATQSKAKFFQGSGRGSRADDGKLYYILFDFGGNIERHGSPTGFQDYSIDPKPIKESNRQLLKTCPNCNLICSTFLSLCPECHYEFSHPKDPVPEDHDLLSIPFVELFSSLERQQVQFLRKAKKICYSRNLNPDIAIEQFQKRFGFEPYYEWHFQAALGATYSLQEKQEFIQYLKRHVPSIHAAHWLTINIHLEFGDNEHQPIVLDTQRTYPGWWEIFQVPETATYEKARDAYLTLAAPWQLSETQDPDAPFRIKQLNWAWQQALEHFQNTLSF